MPQRSRRSLLGARSGIGIEVGPDYLRALRPGGFGGRPDALEVAWGPSPPPESVQALRERFGSGNALAVALDMSFVFVKRIDLPPLSTAERRRIVETDPDRYFPVRGETLVAGVREDDLVVAARTDAVDHLIEALSPLGSVERVEPAAVAIGRHLAAGGTDEAVLVMPTSLPDETTVATLRGGRIRALRRVGSRADAAAAVGAVPELDACVVFPWSEDAAEYLARQVGRVTPSPVQSPPGVAPPFSVAHGAVLGLEVDDELTLTTPALGRRISAARRRRGLLHAVALTTSMALLVVSLDHRREVTLVGLRERVEDAQARAEPLLTLRADAAAMAEDLAYLSRESSARENPLEVLLAVSRILPRDAYLTQITASNGEWELSGLARDAARLVPALESSELLADVRFRTATTPVRVRDERYESFSVIFRHVPPT